MTTHFYDTSAIVKRYFVETGSERVDVMLTDSASSHIISRLTLAEVNAAIVRRAPSNDVADLTVRFDNDAETVFGYVVVVDAMFDEAVVLVRRHRLRGCDSLQLASALHLSQALQALDEENDLVFVCADGDLNAAALVEGLAVINPGDALELTGTTVD